MKKLILHASLAITTVTLLASCYSSKNTHNDSSTIQTKSSTMERIKTTSGLEYEVLQEGTGNTPNKGQTIAVHYTGWINNNGEKGNKFDSSVDRGEPLEFPIGIGYVIKGWDEGVMGMKCGEKRRLFIPASLGYGARGAGRAIPPHANLIFDVELISIQ